MPIADRMTGENRSGESRGFFVWLVIASLALLWAVAMPGEARAQLSLSTLRGTVKDKSGALVPQATVTLNDAVTGAQLRKATSNREGDFEFPDLKPGTYQLECVVAGFESFKATDVVLDSGQTRRVDVLLSIGQVGETVQVSAGAAVIDTETGTIGGQLSQREIDDAPQIDNYPSPSVLLTMLPGVQGGTGGLAGLRISGLTSTQQSEGFDGVINDLGGGNSNNPAFFSQITAISVNAPAEDSRIAYHNLTTKSATNAFHGSAYYRVYSSGLMARAYFAPTRTPYLQHVWDLELGGPIFKNRTFLYGMWYAEKIPLGSAANATVPTPAMRAGDFSGVSTQLKNPRAGYAVIPGNQVQAFISPVSNQLQTILYPLPTVNPTAKYYSVNNLPFTFSHPSDVYKGDWPMFRLDQNITQKNSLFVRWLMRRNPYILQNGLPTEVWTRWRDEQQWAIGDTQVFSPHLVNTLTLGMSREFIKDGEAIDGTTPLDGADLVGQVGLQGSNPGNTHGQGLPTMSISGLTTLQNDAGGVQSNNFIYTYMDSVTWNHGRHVVSAGASYQNFSQFVGALPNYGSFTFDGSMTGNAYADFLMGIPKQSNRITPIPNRTEHAGEFGAYVEDTFKVNQRLTMQYGLRWDYFQSPTYDDKMMYRFDPVSGNILVPQEALSKVSPLYAKLNLPVAVGNVTPSPDTKNFRPRVSLAYRVAPNLVLRGGYGAFTERIGYFSLVSGGGPFQITETYQNQANQPLVVQFPNPYPSSTASATVPSQSVVEFPTQVDNGIYHQYNVTLEQQFGKEGFRISYVGMRGMGLNYSLNINQPRPGTTPFVTSSRPYPQFVNVTQYRSDGAQHYDTLQLETLRRVGSITYDLNYSWTKNILNDQDLENPYDVLGHWSNETATRRHYFGGHAIWAIPVGRGQRFLGKAPAWVDAGIGNWRLYFASYFASGLYYSPSFSGTNPSNTGLSGGLPDQIGDSTPANRTYSTWWNKNAFVLPQSGHFGNARPFSLEGQNLIMQHLSVVKSYKITPRVLFTFTTAVSNLFNHPGFNGAQTNISTSNFGAFTSIFGLQTSNESAAQRQITFQGKFSF